MKNKTDFNLGHIEFIEVPFGEIKVPQDYIRNKLTKKDVWGNECYDKEDRGMRVAVYNEKCPIFKDIVPYKNTTFVCDENLREEVLYWIKFVYGKDCIEREKGLKDNKIAIRAFYNCI